MTVIKQIKKNRERLLLNNYFNTLECEASPSIGVIKYNYVYIPIIAIYIEQKVIRVRYDLLPNNVKVREYIDEYIKIILHLWIIK